MLQLKKPELEPEESDRQVREAVEAMLEVGYDLERHRSIPLDELPDVAFDVVVTMGCGDACPNVRAARREDWEIPDPAHLPEDEFRSIRDLIESKVLALLAEDDA